eukprot:1240432-Prymnesium_polylepis.1
MSSTRTAALLRARRSNWRSTRIRSDCVTGGTEGWRCTARVNAHAFTVLRNVDPVGCKSKVEIFRKRIAPGCRGAHPQISAKVLRNS